MMKMREVSGEVLTKGVMTNLREETLAAQSNAQKLLGKRSLLGP